MTGQRSWMLDISTWNPKSVAISTQTWFAQSQRHYNEEYQYAYLEFSNKISKAGIFLQKTVEVISHLSVLSFYLCCNHVCKNHRTLVLVSLSNTISWSETPYKIWNQLLQPSRRSLDIKMRFSFAKFV